jgi:hypothetical protein
MKLVQPKVQSVRCQPGNGLSVRADGERERREERGEQGGLIMCLQECILTNRVKVKKIRTEL